MSTPSALSEGGCTWDSAPRGSGKQSNFLARRVRRVRIYWGLIPRTEPSPACSRNCPDPGAAHAVLGCAISRAGGPAPWWGGWVSPAWWGQCQVEEPPALLPRCGDRSELNPMPSWERWAALAFTPTGPGQAWWLQGGLCRALPHQTFTCPLQLGRCPAADPTRSGPHSGPAPRWLRVCRPLPPASGSSCNCPPGLRMEQPPKAAGHRPWTRGDESRRFSPGSEGCRAEVPSLHSGPAGKQLMEPACHGGQQWSQTAGAGPMWWA